jgi:hypothetical protein
LVKDGTTVNSFLLSVYQERLPEKSAEAVPGKQGFCPLEGKRWLKERSAEGLRSGV